MTKRCRSNNSSKPSTRSLIDGEEDALTYVEFYSGVGGWKMAMEEALRSLKEQSPADTSSATAATSNRCCAALDHSDLCVKVYGHNHMNPIEKDEVGISNKKKKKRNGVAPKAVRIEQLCLRQLSEWKADVWMMSPPCQPHTRQNSSQDRDLDDPRSESFLHLCRLLSDLPDDDLPSMLLLENVVGFESSSSCQRWRGVLSHRRYAVGHFRLQPHQVRLPNDRPRYYCVAVRGEQGSAISDVDPAMATADAATKRERLGSLGRYLKREDGAEIDRGGPPLMIHTCLPELGVVASNEGGSVSAGDGDDPLPTIAEFLDDSSTLTQDQSLALRVPESVLRRDAAWCFDVVSPGCRRSACFTSGYGKYVRGAGSVLYLGRDTRLFRERLRLSEAVGRKFDRNWTAGIEHRDLRYFSGTEMARLLGFPETFSFPADVTHRQQWKLLGNSINVRVASKLVELGMRLLPPGRTCR